MKAAIPLLLAGSLTGGALAASGEDLFVPPPRDPDAVRALLVTGGHDHDISFYSVLDGRDDLAVMVDSHPGALTGGSLDEADVAVFYDMPASMTPSQRRRLRSFVEAGGGIVVLHHALWGRIGWEWWWKGVVGGRHVNEPVDDWPVSTWDHGQEIDVRVAAQHLQLPGQLGDQAVVEGVVDLWSVQRQPGHPTRPVLGDQQAGHVASSIQTTRSAQTLSATARWKRRSAVTTAQPSSSATRPESR